MEDETEVASDEKSNATERPPERQFFRDYDDSSDEEDLAPKTTAIHYEQTYHQAFPTHSANHDQRIFWLVHILANRVLYSREVNRIYYQQMKPQLQEAENISRSDIQQLLTEIIHAVIHDISTYLLMDEDDRELTEEDLADLTSEVFKEFNLDEITETILQQLSALKIKTSQQLSAAIINIFRQELTEIPFNPLQAGQGDLYCYSLPFEPNVFLADEYHNKKRAGFASNIVTIALDSIKERIASHEKCFKNGDPQRNTPFTTPFIRVRDFSWNIVRPLNGSRNPRKAVEVQHSALIPLYLQDIMDLDNADLNKPLDTVAWLEATKNRHSWWFIDFLALTDERIQHLIRIYLDKYTTEIVKGFFSAHRPTLGNAHTFNSENPVDFMANLRLANRSIKRELKNIEGDEHTRKIYVSDCPKAVHFHWSFFKKPRVPALETQTVNASTRTRTTLVDNAGSYAEVFTNIQKMQQILHAAGKPHTDQAIGLLLRAWVKGTLTETIGTYNREVRDIIFERISAIGYLLFGCEVTRNPGTLIVNQMMLDLIISGPNHEISWKTLLTHNRLMPMADSDSIKRARRLNGYFKNTSGIIFSYLFDSSSDSLNTSSEGFGELFTSECALVKQWLKLKNIDVKSNLDDMARSICQNFNAWFGDNCFDTDQFVLPPPQSVQRPRRGTIRLAKK